MGSAYGIGGAVGPIIGTSLYQFVGFRNMCNVVGGVCMVFAMLYFALCSGCEAWRLTKSRGSIKGQQMSDIELLSASIVTSCKQIASGQDKKQPCGSDLPEYSEVSSPLRVSLSYQHSGIKDRQGTISFIVQAEIHLEESHNAFNPADHCKQA